MKKHYVVVFACMVVFMLPGCKKISSKQELEKISNLELRVDSIRNLGPMSASSPNFKQKFTELGQAYESFARTFPEAPETPAFLFKAGELYSNDLQDYPKAIELFLADYEKYPSHETSGNALFFVAYHYNNSLHDIRQAEKYYREFLKNYPTHKMVASAEFELQSLGMPVDALIEKLTAADTVSVAVK